MITHHNLLRNSRQVITIDGMERLGMLIESARERRGYKTQTAFAEAIGWTQNKYSRMERMGRGGMKDLPGPDDLRLVGDALGLSMGEMLEAAGYLKPATDAGDVITVPAADPRARLLEAVAGMTDEQVERWAASIALLSGAAQKYAETNITGSATGTHGVPSQRTDDRKVNNDSA